MAGTLRQMLVATLVLGTVCCVSGAYIANKDFLRAETTRNTASPLLVTLANRTNCGPDDTTPANRVDTTYRVDELVKLLESNSYDAYIISSGDEHQSEYPPDPDLRRGYISGFSGSAGTAVVLADGQRALWTDGRYFLQADDELDCNWLFMKDEQAGVPTILQFLQDNLSTGNVVSADAKLIGYGSWNELKTGLEAVGVDMEPSTENLVDIVWENDPDVEHPQYGSDPAIVHPIEYAGRTVDQKLTDVRADMASKGADALIITALDEVAWLYNIRGKDVTYNPVLRSYAIITPTSATLYVDQAKILTDVTIHLDQFSVSVSDYMNVWTDLQALSMSSSMVFLPDDSLSAGCSFEVYNSVEESKRLLAVTPTLLLKAQKNAVELEKMREALVRDGVALSDFLAFLESEITSGEVYDELRAQNLLTQYRSEQVDYMDLSFETISGYGEHGAIIHYESTELTNVDIGTESLYLLDSGGQYLGATTDVTRTMHYGTPTPEMKEMYTRVLMGVIDFASIYFPQNKKKSEIDVVARKAIYAKGLDYRHGTSHGIGMFLNVHEPVTDELKLGYVQSDEPGYYQDGEWGIRIENQVVVVDTGLAFDSPFYTFDTMTLVPMEPKLIDVNLFNADQIAWLNAYNQEIRDVVGAEMLEQNRNDGYQWLLTKTEPLGVENEHESETDGATNGSPTQCLLLAGLAAVTAVVMRIGA